MKFYFFLIPGLDIIRLVFERLIKGKSPLEGDKKHLHHIILSVSKYELVWILNLLIIFIPIIILKISTNFYFSLIISIIIYLMLIYFSSKKI